MSAGLRRFRRDLAEAPPHSQAPAMMLHSQEAAAPISGDGSDYVQKRKGPAS